MNQSLTTNEAYCSPKDVEKTFHWEAKLWINRSEHFCSQNVFLSEDMYGWKQQVCWKKSCQITCQGI